MRYRADLTAGALKVPESRRIADLLLDGVSGRAWKEAIEQQNVLQARSRATAIRLARLIRLRLETMDDDLWKLVRDGAGNVATHAVLAAAVKHSLLLGDFLDLVVREQFRLFNPKLSKPIWDSFLDDCRGRDSGMPLWSTATRDRLRSAVFQSLAQAGYLSDSRSLKLQPVNISRRVLAYLEGHDEAYVLRCLEVSP